MDLKPAGDLHELFRRLVDIESVSMHEAPIADAVEETLAPHRHLEVTRLGNSVVARTHLGRSERVVIAGHLTPFRSSRTCRPILSSGRTGITSWVGARAT